MRRIRLTKGKTTVVDDCDYQYLNRWNWSYSTGYAVRSVAFRDVTGRKRSITIMMHREVARRAGKDVSNLIDHKNGKRLDNQRRNLRPATKQQNQRNRHKVWASSGHRGVYQNNGGRWQARINIGTRIVNLGTYDTIKQAYGVRLKAEKKYFGEFAPQ